MSDATEEWGWLCDTCKGPHAEFNDAVCCCGGLTALDAVRVPTLTRRQITETLDRISSRELIVEHPQAFFPQAAAMLRGDATRIEELEDMLSDSDKAARQNAMGY